MVLSYLVYKCAVNVCTNSNPTFLVTAWVRTKFFLFLGRYIVFFEGNRKFLNSLDTAYWINIGKFPVKQSNNLRN